MAAGERLATIFGDEHPVERRDAGVLLLHAGRFPQVGVASYPQPALLYITCPDAQMVAGFDATVYMLVLLLLAQRSCLQRACMFTTLVT